MFHIGHILLLLWFCVGQLQFTRAQGARSHGLGGCKATLTDGWSVFNNPAGLTSERGFGGLLSFEQKFLLTDLAEKYFGASLPTNKGVFGVGFVASGFSLLRKNELSIAYGTKLAKNFSVGVRISYFMVKYGDQFFAHKYIRADIGFNYWVNEKLIVTSFANNLGALVSGASQSPIYSARLGLYVGINYQLSSKVLIVSEVAKTLLLPLNFKFGLEYELVENLLLRAGLYTQRLTNTFGVGYRIKQITLDVGGEKHPVLGYSLTCSFLVKLNNKVKKE